MKKLGKFVYIFLFLGYFIAFYVLSHASIVNIIFPFAIGFMFALVWSEQKVWLVCPAFLLAQIASNFTFEGAISAICAACLIAIPFYTHVLLKKRMRKWELGLFCLIAQTAEVVFAALNGVNPAYIVAGVLACVAFMYMAMCIFEPLIVRGFAYKLTSLQLICGTAIVVALSDGLMALDLFGFSIIKMFAAFLLLVILQTTKPGIVCLAASLIGLGTLVGSGNPVLMAPFIIWSLAISCFKGKNRLFPAVALVLADLVAGFGFNLYYTYGFLQIAPVLAGSAIFLLLPTKVFDNVAALFSFNSDRLASKNLLNRSRELTFRKISFLSEVFCEMNLVFKKLIRKSLSEDDAKKMLYDEIKNGVCANCPERTHCHRTFCADTQEIISQLFAIAMQRGKITLLDIPSFLSSRCNKINALISEINTLSSQYKSYSSLVSNVDTSKMLISDQLSGISQILKNLASENQTSISFDTARENKIIDELAMNNIICTDAVVYEKDNKSFLANLIVREEDATRHKIPEVVGKICGCKMCVSQSYPTVRAGLVNLNLTTSPRFDCVFGMASTNKAGSAISGDTHSVVRLDNNKFLFALCDGMGSGEKANEKSETTIGLIENFYKAGYDNDIILSSVNKLLNLEHDDSFSTIDVCVLDLKNGLADFVKMGSPASIIRRADGVEMVECSALPIGIVQDAVATTKKVVLAEKDFVILCSDGISDAFSSDLEMKDFILSIKTANPQEFADQILAKALAGNNGYAVDDMTCLVIKIFMP